MNYPKTTSLLCRKIKGGKHSIWHSWHASFYSFIIGKGETAEKAIEDCQKQHREYLKRITDNHKQYHKNQVQ